MNPAGQTLLVFQLQAQRYALQLDAVQRVLPMMAVEPLPGAPDVVAGVVDVAGSVVPVLDARRRFGLPHRAARLSDVLILIRAGALDHAGTAVPQPTSTRTFALAADGVIGLMELKASDVTPAGSITPEVMHVAGVAKLDDGLVLIHDVETFLAAAERVRLDGALASSEVPP
jgi:purine-binding chemotaxis protein CheW